MESAPNRHWNTLAFAWRSAWSASRTATISVVALQVLGAVAIAAQLALLAQIVSKIEANEQAWTTPTVRLLVLFGVALTATALVTAATRELRTLLVERVSLRTTERLLAFVGSQRFAKIESPLFHDQLQRARTSSDQRLFQMLWGAINLFSSCIQLLAIGAVLLALAPVVLLVAGLAGVPLVIASRINTRALYRHAFDLTGDDRRRGWLERVLLDRRAGAELEVTRARPVLEQRVSELSRNRENFTEGLIKKRLAVSAASAIASAAIASGAVAVLLGLVFSGDLSLSNAAVAVIALQQVRTRTTGVASAVNDLAESAVFASDITYFLEHEDNRRQRRVRVHPQQTVALDDITFTYEGSAGSPAVADVSLEIEIGQTLAIVGENGSGKTTLAKLLAGVYQPDQGAIVADGEPLDDTTALHVAAVFQDFNRYDLSIAENITIGDPEVPPDDARMVAAAESAGIRDAIESLPDGYSTILAREYAGGTEFSGGQWQRVAIARAFYGSAPVFVLDEPSAALDVRSERALFEAVAAHSAGRFTVVISHRFSTVRSADLIAVMHGGHLEELGTHDDLMAAGGRYAELFALQASPYFDL